MENKKKYSLTEFINYIRSISEKREIYIYGAGTYGKIYGNFFQLNNINWEGYIDTNSKLVGNFLYQKQIFGRGDIAKYSDGVVIVSLSKQIYGHDFNDLYVQLNKAGINKEDILYFGDDFELLDSIIISTKDANNILKRNLKIKDVYNGKRCFLIGNGPSLRLEDINKLSAEISMGCNNIYQLFEKSSWRPKCFFVEDNIFLNEHVQTENELEYFLNNCEYLFTTLRSDLYEKYLHKYDKLFYLYTCKTQIKDIMFSPDLTQKIYSAATTLYTMLQVAVYMGISEIYLLGVDFSFKREVRENGCLEVNTEIKNHADIIEETDGIYNTDTILRGYMVAKEYADLHGIKIYNATRGGKLEVFERVNFDDLF